MTTNIYINDTVREALARLAYAEAANITGVSNSLRYGSVVDAVINRAAVNTPHLGGSQIVDVINQNRGGVWQFSPVGDTDEGTWEGLPVPPNEVVDVVNAHINFRLAGGDSTVGTATHYINPTAPGTAYGWVQWGHSLQGTTTVGPPIWDEDGYLANNLATHYFGNTANSPGEYPDDYMLIGDVQPGAFFDVPDYVPVTLPIEPPVPQIRPENRCFPAGTEITLADGSTKLIEEIAIDDQVLAPNGLGELVSARVSKLFTNTTQAWVKLSFDDERDELVATSGHHFLTETGDYMEIGHMLRLGGGAGVGSVATNGGAIKSGSVRVVDVDGSIVEATGEVLVYSEETAGLFSSSQTKTIAFEGNAVLKEEVEAGWKTYNFEVRELHNYVANDNDEQTAANDALEFCHKLAA